LASSRQCSLIGEIESVKTALFFYKYPLIEEPTDYQGLRIVGLKDLAAMKLDTVISRGTKRNFIDLYFLIKRLMFVGNYSGQNLKVSFARDDGVKTDVSCKSFPDFIEKNH
jgi:hypothetical protein